jgi:hypothetical protein
MDGWEEKDHFKFWWGCPGCQQGPRPHVRTLGAWADLPLRWVRPERHMALGLAYPCPGHEPGPRLHMGTPDTWAACACARPDPRATWRDLAFGLPCLCAGLDHLNYNKNHNIQNTNNTIFNIITFIIRIKKIFVPQIIIFINNTIFSINTFNDNKNNNLCTTNNINIITFNYNKNKNICTANNNIQQIIIFFILML